MHQFQFVELLHLQLHLPLLLLLALSPLLEPGHSLPWPCQLLLLQVVVWLMWHLAAVLV